MKNYLCILFMLLFLIGKAETNDILHFVPEGYILFDKYFSDLNKDGQEDCVLIIKEVNEENIVFNRFEQEVDRNRRGIIILFKNEDRYELVDENHSCFLSENEDGGVYYPPELSIDVEKENLVIHFSHGRYGYWSYVFKFQKDGFQLIGYDSSSNYGPIVQKETSINFLSKKKLIRENIHPNAEGNDEIFKETWSEIEIDELLNLSEIQDFNELNMYDY